MRKHLLNEHLLTISPLRRKYFHIIYYIFFVFIIVYIAVAVLNQYPIRKYHIIISNASDYEPDIKNNPSFWAVFKPLYVLISCVYCLCEYSTFGGLITIPYATGYVPYLVDIAVAVLNQYPIRKYHIIIRNASDYEPDIKSNPSFWAVFEPLYELSCVHCLCERSTFGGLITVLTLIISICIIIYCN